MDGSERRLIRCGSRLLTDPKSRWAVTELEALGVFYALDKLHFYLYFAPQFTVQVDHKPLIGIFEKPYDSIPNPRLRAVREKCLPYDFKVEYVPGSQHVVPDFLSRHPVDPAPDDEDPDLTIAH